jgi:hypothetical protein
MKDSMNVAPVGKRGAAFSTRAAGYGFFANVTTPPATSAKRWSRWSNF